MMAEKYGMLPTEVLDQRPRDFWFNATIAAATGRALERQRQGGTKRASDAEQTALHHEQEGRAEVADDLDGDQDVQEQRQVLQQIDGGES